MERNYVTATLCIQKNAKRICCYRVGMHCTVIVNTQPVNAGSVYRPSTREHGPCGSLAFSKEKTITMNMKSLYQQRALSHMIGRSVDCRHGTRAHGCYCSVYTSHVYDPWTRPVSTAVVCMDRRRRGPRMCTDSLLLSQTTGCRRRRRRRCRWERQMRKRAGQEAAVEMRRWSRLEGVMEGALVDDGGVAACSPRSRRWIELGAAASLQHAHGDSTIRARHRRRHRPLLLLLLLLQTFTFQHHAHIRT